MPEDALREAILNAIIHRNYAIGSPVQIRVYANCLKIWNPGELPEHWSLEKLLKQHPSHPFNPCVANAFFRAGEIEAWGRGIQRILDACREAGTPEPKMLYEPGDLWIEFPFSSEYLKIIPDATSDSTLTEASGKTSGKTSGKIVELMRQRPGITIPEIAGVLGKTPRAIEMQVNKLKADQLIGRVGPAKGGHWEVLK